MNCEAHMSASICPECERGLGTNVEDCGCCAGFVDGWNDAIETAEGVVAGMNHAPGIIVAKALRKLVRPVR